MPKIVIFGESQKQGFFHKSAHNSKFEGEHTHLSAYRLVLRTLAVNLIGVTYPQLAASRRDFGLKFVDFSDIKNDQMSIDDPEHSETSNAGQIWILHQNLYIKCLDFQRIAATQ